MILNEVVGQIAGNLGGPNQEAEEKPENPFRLKADHTKAFPRGTASTPLVRATALPVSTRSGWRESLAQSPGERLRNDLTHPQFVGSAKTQWGRLTDDELDKADGEKDRLAGLIQEKYGVTKEEANRQIDDWAAKDDVG